MRKYILLLCIACSTAWATTRNAATCNASDIQTQINASAASGDIVVVPSGSCSWSGTTGVSITNKSIKLQGQSTVSQDRQTVVDSTNITDNTSVVGLDINGASTTNFVEVTGFTFIANVSKSRGMVEADGTNAAQNSFRIHNNHFIINAAAPRGINITNIYGLVDHNLFSVGSSGSVQSISVFGCSDGNDGGFTCWNQPESLGTNNAVFEEDNDFIYTFHTESVIDNYGGARYVFRHNNVTNAEACGGHGTDSGNRRSAFSFECYSNVYTNTSGARIRMGTIRGGTGVHYNNTYASSGAGSGWDGVALMLYRACTGLDQSGWGTANGTNYALGSANLSVAANRQVHTTTGAASASNVLWCSNHRDTLCTSNAQCTGGGTCTTFFDSAGTRGYPARDQPGATHDQIIDPVYSWNNTVNGTPTASLGTYDGGEPCATTAGAADNLTTWLQTPRDYVNNGTTPKPGYTAFTYPNPLQGGSTPVVSDPTASPTAGVYSTTQSVALSTTTSGATICYTTNGSTPGSSPAGTCAAGSTTYSTLISVPSTTTIKALGTKTANTDSNVVTFVYTISVAGTLYVNNSGSPACSDTAGQAGDSSHPFCTVSYGVSRLVGGGTLNVMSGTYPGDFTITGPSGTAGAHTVIQCVAGQSCILQGPSINNGRMKITGGCQYIDFTGFEITNHNQGLYLDDDAGTSVACTNVIVSNVNIHDVGQEGIAVRAGNAPTARNFLIQNSSIHDTGKLDPNQNGEGVYIGNSSGTDTTNGVTLLNNTINSTTSECIELKGDSHDNIIDGNNLSNCITSSAGFGNGGGAIEVDEPRNSATDPHQIIRNNVIHDLPTASGITKHAIRLGTGATVYNNIIYNVGSNYSCILSNTSNFTRLIYQNTVDCPVANAVVNSGTTIDSRNNLGPSGTNNLIINSSYFFNYGAHDYRINQGATPVGAGANLLSTVPFDIAGFARPNPPTIGAYEFIQSNPPTPAVVLACPASPCTVVAFGNQTNNATSVAQNILLTNNGTGTLNISSIALSGLDAAQFAVTNNCGSTVVANTNCTASITFTPASSGAKSASVVFTNDASNSPQTVSLTGSGIVNPTPSVSTTIQGTVSTSGGITIK